MIRVITPLRNRQVLSCTYMNIHRSEMEGMSALISPEHGLVDNVTIRRSAGDSKNKMAQANKTLNHCDLEHNGSLLIDSILSQDEAAEVVSMLNMANELNAQFLHLLADGR